MKESKSMIVAKDKQGNNGSVLCNINYLKIEEVEKIQAIFLNFFILGSHKAFNLTNRVIMIILWEVHWSYFHLSQGLWTKIEHQHSTSLSKCPVDNLQFMYLMRTSSKLGSLALSAQLIKPQFRSRLTPDSVLFLQEVSRCF